MNSSPVAEIFARKTVLLHSADNVSETIRCGRYLKAFAGVDTTVIVEDLHGLGDVFKMINADVSVINPEEGANCSHDIEYDLKKLQFFLKESRSDASLFPYLIIPERLTRHTNNLFGEELRRKVGLCLSQPQGRHLSNLPTLPTILPFSRP